MVNVYLKSGIFKRKMGRVMILDVLWTSLFRRKIIDLWVIRHIIILELIV